MTDRRVADEVDLGTTVQRFLHDRAGLPHADAKGLIASGRVRVNGRVVVRAGARIAAGDVVEFERPSGRVSRVPRRPRTRGPGFRIVHEGDGFVVVDKSPGILTVPHARSTEDALVHRIEESLRRRGFREPRVRAVHRIDRHTSGLVVLAWKHAPWLALRRAFAATEPERLYAALAEGRFVAERGRMVHALVEDRARLRVRVAIPPQRGRHAACRYRVLERFAHATLLEVVLETGRRNQIRVQLAAEGHPLVGDVTYGRRSPWIARPALHARSLAFRDPRSGARLSFESPIPADFRRAAAALRRGASLTPPRGPERRST